MKAIKSSTLAPFLLLLAFYCGWVFSLPLFPSLDGSLHLYYASVLGSLLTGSKTFSSFYYVKHVLPPYALHYYFLIAAAHFLGYVMADKLLVCLILIVTAFGFRYLGRQLGPSGDILSILVIPLLLNWPLGMGFYNYCLAIGMALWALGLWFQAVATRRHRHWLAFVAVVLLMVITHPVPTLLVYVLIGCDVCWRLIADARAQRKKSRLQPLLLQHFRWDFVYMLCAWATFGYIALFIRRHHLAANGPSGSSRHAVLIKLVKLSSLAMFSGSHAAVVLYRLSLYCILFLAAGLAILSLKATRRDHQWINRRLVLLAALFLLAMVPMLPPVVNGANYFSQRLVILVWLGVLAAASGYSFSGRQRRTFTIATFLYGIFVLGMANFLIRPTALRISQIETTPLAETHDTGLVLALPAAPDPTTLNYFPYYWAGSRYFRRTQSTLLNSGWLYESYFPLGSRLTVIDPDFTPELQDAPGDVYRLLRNSQHARQRILPYANLIVFTGAFIPVDLDARVNTLDDTTPRRLWTCHPAAWYAVCTASSHASLPLH